MLETVSITVEARCNTLFCDAKRAQVTGKSMAECRRQLKARGWAIRRQAGHEVVQCRTCAARTDKMIRDGILSRDGAYILDMPRWEAAVGHEVHQAIAARERIRP